MYNLYLVTFPPLTKKNRSSWFLP